jgi:hypothetical protein
VLLIVQAIAKEAASSDIAHSKLVA